MRCRRVFYIYKRSCLGASLLGKSEMVDLVSNRWNEILRELSEWNQLKIAHEAHFATR